MSLAKTLTPENTEEIKPGIFIQKRKEGYRVVDPLFWNGKFRKEHLKKIITIRTIFTIALIVFIAWSYLHDVQAYKDFHDEVLEDPISFCNDVYLNLENEETNTRTLPVYNEKTLGFRPKQ